MSKGLEALGRIKDDMVYQLRIKGECVVNDDFFTVEKELRALETIVEFMDMCFEKGLITEEEYDAFKEVVS